MRGTKESLKQAANQRSTHRLLHGETELLGLFKVSSGSMLSMQVGCDVP